MEDRQALSLQNPKLKTAASLKHRKYRERLGLVLVEGERVIRQAVSFGARFRYFLVHRESADPMVLEVVRSTGAEILPVSLDGLRKVSDTPAPQGVIGIAESARADANLLERSRWVLIADRVRDPGNLGALIRIGKAADMDGIISTKGSADFGHPRAIRASAGGYFALPHWTGPAPEELARQLAGSSWRVVVAHADAEVDVFSFDWTGKVALVIGNESEGPDPAFHAVGERVGVPMPGGIESLNAAVAAGVIVYQAMRARSS